MTSCTRCCWEVAASRWVLRGCVRSLHHLMSHGGVGGEETLKHQPPTSLQGYKGVRTGLNIHCVLGELPNACISAWLLLVGVNTFFPRLVFVLCFPPELEFFAVLSFFLFVSFFSFSIWCCSKNTAEVLGAQTKPVYYALPD